MEKIEVQLFGVTPQGEEVKTYTLRNKNGLILRVLSYGGIIQSLEVPDRYGKVEDIVLGFDTLEEYVNNNSPYFGAIIGRFANRIANGKFTIGDREYSVATNNGDNHLHGGGVGFNAVVWKVEDVSSKDEHSLKLFYLSVDGEEGYPGNLEVEVMYTLTSDNTVEINYKAKTDKPTIINLTHHSYFNLNLSSNNNILDHQLQLNADQYLPVNAALIPTGKFKPVIQTPFDFTKQKTIGEKIDSKYEQLIRGNGYDHCWIIRQGAGNVPAAKVYDQVSGRCIEVFTTEPGIQFYSGNFLDGTIKGKRNQIYTPRMGMCLETQHFPDSPNQNEFPSVILNPGDFFISKTAYRFSFLE